MVGSELQQVSHHSVACSSNQMAVGSAKVCLSSHPVQSPSIDCLRPASSSLCFG